MVYRHFYRQKREKKTCILTIHSHRHTSNSIKSMTKMNELSLQFLASWHWQRECESLLFVLVNERKWEKISLKFIIDNVAIYNISFLFWINKENNGEFASLFSRTSLSQVNHMRLYSFLCKFGLMFCLNKPILCIVQCLHDISNTMTIFKWIINQKPSSIDSHKYDHEIHKMKPTAVEISTVNFWWAPTFFNSTQLIANLN